MRTELPAVQRNLADRFKKNSAESPVTPRRRLGVPANRVRGAAQDLYGQARDAGSEMAGAAADRASSLETRLRNFIETQPYTAVAIAAGVGWLLGRTNRPF